MHARLLPIALAWLVAGAGVSAQSLRVPVTDPGASSLDRYVAAPDPAYKWSVVSTRQEGDLTITVIDMTSQSWRKDNEVDRTEWRHWLTVIRPSSITSETSMLFITGGDNDGTGTLPKLDPMLATIAAKTGTIVTELRMVPNQPLTFAGEQPREEDEMIAYAWDKFLKGGDDEWLPRLPMTKAAVRAMDTVQAFAQTPRGGRRALAKFVVSGASKRGWTAWTTAVVDSRVVAVIPIVIDLLNLEPSFQHHYRAYGFWAPAVKDYQDLGIMAWMGTPRFRDLQRVVEPYEYRSRLTLPKYILNASGDQFFLPDSWQFYFDDLSGEKYLRYVPNADHSLRKSNAAEGLLAYYGAIVSGTPRPAFTWSAGKDGHIVVRPSTRPQRVTFWQATNPRARDFRLETLGPVWAPTILKPQADGSYTATVKAPEKGWTAGFVEIAFENSVAPFIFSTGVRVMPDTLPFPAPQPRSTATRQH